MFKIILTKNVNKLGEQGDIVEVKDGYARNFLIPEGLAIGWTKKAAEHIQVLAKSRQVKAANDIKAAEELAKDLSKFGVIELKVKATKTGKLYGSVTAKKIAEAIYSSVKIKVAEKAIELTEHIKEGGAYSVNIALHPEVVANVKIKVTPNGSDK
ncbi:MAG: 50S ribosomal protein L9 [Bifidobacteriaceae bacterium]|jgi:large subunit ribosomal protein L9|nr:50S ribosomal protein L9 [Bifidobacteriaceae bacterium]